MLFLCEYAGRSVGHVPYRNIPEKLFTTQSINDKRAKQALANNLYHRCHYISHKLNLKGSKMGEIAEPLLPDHVTQQAS